jgi:L-ascorbate metabolism protein UlaG (beta-lactamase superfamily)
LVGGYATEDKVKIIWLGHSGFRIEIEDQVLLVDPWLVGNPVFPQGRRAEATSGATHILLTHGHGDHASNATAISKELGIPVACIHELSEILGAEDGVKTIGFGKGGTISLGKVRVSMVHAVHSSSIDFRGDGPVYAGGEAGFMIAGEKHMIYVSGDTGIMADMEWMGEYYRPDIGILCSGGHYTMDMKGAAWAARKFFDFQTVIPCHYKTFPILAQSADEMIEALPGVKVIEPEVLKAIEV